MRLIVSCRRLAGFVAACFMAALLSACAVTSTTIDIVDPAEGAQLLPATVVLRTYNEADGGFALHDDPGTFQLKNNGYVAEDGSMSVYFVPLAGREAHLLYIVADGQAMYGLARLRGDILELRVLFAGEPATEMATAGSLPVGAQFTEGGIRVTDRPSLDTVIGLMADGKLTTTPLLAWIGNGTAPRRIVRDGDWYKDKS